MCVCVCVGGGGGGGGWGGVGVNIEWGTLPYPAELKWKVGVKCVWGGRVGYPTTPYPSLRSSCGL